MSQGSVLQSAMDKYYDFMKYQISDIQGFISRLSDSHTPVYARFYCNGIPKNENKIVVLLLTDGATFGWKFVSIQEAFENLHELEYYLSSSIRTDMDVHQESLIACYRVYDDMHANSVDATALQRHQHSCVHGIMNPPYALFSFSGTSSEYEKSVLSSSAMVDLNIGSDRAYCIQYAEQNAKGMMSIATGVISRCSSADATRLRDLKLRLDDRLYRAITQVRQTENQDVTLLLQLQNEIAELRQKYSILENAIKELELKSISVDTMKKSPVKRTKKMPL